MRKIIIVVTAILLAGCASKSDLDAALSENKDMNSLVLEQKEIIADLEDQVNDLEETITKLESDFEILTEENDETKDELSEKKKDLLIAERDLKLHICNIQIDDMKYDNILNISTYLAGWYAQLPGIQSVQLTYRDSIWNNTDTKIHSVTYTDASDHQQYVDHFLVYFDEFGWNPSIFWLSEQCWLDSPY